MNNKKITSNVSEKDKVLLCVLGIILVLSLSYIFIFSPLQKKSETLATDNDGLREYITVLDSMRQNEEQKKVEITEFNEQRDEMLGHFPRVIKNENVIEIMNNIESETEIITSQNTIVLNDLVFNQENSRNNGEVSIDTSDDIVVDSPYKPEINQELIQQYGDVVTLRCCVTALYSGTYEQLTSAIDYINNYDTKMSVDNVTIGYDAESGNVKGTIEYSIYCVDAGVDADKLTDFVGGDYSSIKYGIGSNIFGSHEVKKKKKK